MANNFKDFIKQQARSAVDTGINELLQDVFGFQQEADSGFSVNRLSSAINKSGIAKSSHFEVWLMKGGDGHTQEEERQMTFRADTVDIPGRNFGLADQKHHNIGPVNRVPISQTYPDVTVSFFLSEDLREKGYFEEWQETIMNTGVYEMGSQTNDFFGYGQTSFMMKYFQDYVGKVEIRQYGAGGDLRSIHTLEEAYPISIAPIGMNWADDNPAKLQVTFAYRYYKAVNYRQDQPGLGTGFNIRWTRQGGFQGNFRLPGLGQVGYNPDQGTRFTGDPTIGNTIGSTVYKSIFK